MTGPFRMETWLQSVTDAGGSQAHYIERLWWLMLAVCTAVFVAVMALLVMALWRRRDSDTPPEADAANQRNALRWVAAGGATTAVILFGFLIASLLTDRDLNRIESPNALTITLTAQQWWWDVRYEHGEQNKVIVTANEIHVPVGRPVHFQLKSIDVIHSFWVPSLAGKKDLIPGRDNSVWVQADRAGVFQGQCAEFCGHQHAHMRFQVIAEAPEQFDAWQENQRSLARDPQTPEQKRGREVFLSTTCIMCHAIRGTPAGSRAGPDLTHLASRRTIGASARPNTREHLTRWVLDPQGIKPGSRMPPHSFQPEDLNGLLAYLESLE